MTELMKDFLGAIFRWALTIVFTWLVSKGVIAAADADKFIGGFAAELVGYVVVALPLLWSFWQKIQARLHAKAALAVAPGDAAAVPTRKAEFSVMDAFKD